MKKLPLELSTDGFRLVQVERGDGWAIYAKRPMAGGGETYEVVKVRVSKACSRVIAGKEVEFEECERYPGNEDWGLYGWSYGSLVEARKRAFLLEGVCLGGVLVDSVGRAGVEEADRLGEVFLHKV